MVFVDIHVLIILTQKVKSFVDFDQSLKAVCAASAISLYKHNLHIKINQYNVFLQETKNKVVKISPK